MGMLTEDELEKTLDIAVDAAMTAIDDATTDEDERSQLWTLLAGGVFCAELSKADDAGRRSIAQRLNDRLAKDGCPWRLRPEHD